MSGVEWCWVGNRKEKVEVLIPKVFLFFAVERKFGGVKMRRFRMQMWLLWLSTAVTTLPTLPRQTTSPPPTNAIIALIEHPLYEIHIILHICYSGHVVGRIQEKCQPRDDAGDDEDRPCREDKRSRL